MTSNLSKNTIVRDLDDPSRQGRVTDTTHRDAGYVTVRWADQREPSVEHVDNLEAR